MMSLSDDARSEAIRLLEAADDPAEDYPDRCIATAQVWATLSVSYELAARTA